MGLWKGAAAADGVVHQVQKLFWRTVDLGNTFRRAGLPRLLNQIGQIRIGKNDDRQFGKFRFAANFPDDFDP